MDTNDTHQNTKEEAEPTTPTEGAEKPSNIAKFPVSEDIQTDNDSPVDEALANAHPSIKKALEEMGYSEGYYGVLSLNVNHNPDTGGTTTKFNTYANIPSPLFQIALASFLDDCGWQLQPPEEIEDSDRPQTLR